MTKLIGTAPNQVPTNADLGTLAYQDSAFVNIGGGIAMFTGNVQIGSTFTAIGRLAVDNAALVIPMANFNHTGTTNGYLRFQSSGTSIADIGNTNAILSSGGGVADFGINTRTGSVVFGTGQLERMRVDASGNVGMGITSAGARLHIDSTAGNGITVGQIAQTASQVNIGIGYLTNGRPFVGTNTNSNPLEIGTRLVIETIFVTNSTERMRLSGSNPDLGIGGVPNSNGAGWSTLTLNGSSGVAVEFNTAGVRYGQLLGNTTEVRLSAIGASQVINFQTAGVNSRMTIAASGQIGMGGNTNGISGGVSHILAINYAGGNTQYGLALKSATNTTTAINFVNAADAVIGNITTGASTTAYNTTSDARLKKNVQAAESFGDAIDAMNVVSFDWKIDDEHQRAGFIAQDLHVVAPEAVHVGDSNDEVTEPWSVDYSKLVPMLLKEIQELRARMKTLEAKLA